MNQISQLNTKNGIPVMGFGVYGLNSTNTQKAVTAALAAGYRHFDSAQSYANEGDCGISFKRSNIPREQIFITTKVTPKNYASGKMLDSVRRSLALFDTGYVDLLLIHYPSPWNEIPMEIYLEQLLKVQDAGLARLIGVSNFTISQVNFARQILGNENVATNQVEIHIFMQNRRIVDHCRAVGVQSTAYCALGRGTIFGAPEAELGPHPVLSEIAASHGATIAQIALSFLIHEGHAVLSTATDPSQIASNFAAAKVKLTDTDIVRLRQLDMNKRLIEWPYFPIFD